MENQEDEKEKNLKYLKNDLFYLGFGDKLNTELEKRVDEKPDKFKLAYNAEYNRPDGAKDKVHYLIDFNKSEQSLRYFLNSYTATLRNETDPTQEKSQLFYISKGSGVTAKEAYNLLDGRPVHKTQTNRENQKYEAWVQLDFDKKEPNGNFKQHMFHKNYGYDLPDALAKHPIKELNDTDQKIQLLRALEKGNIRQATFLKEGGEEKVFIVANPQFKNVLVYDSAMKQKAQGVAKEHQPDDKKENKESKEKSKSVKTESDDEDSGKSQKKPKRKRQRV